VTKHTASHVNRSRAVCSLGCRDVARGKAGDHEWIRMSKADSGPSKGGRIREGVAEDYAQAERKGEEERRTPLINW